MGERLMYTPLENVFQDTMNREGHTITAYTTGETFNGFFRRNDDNENTEDTVTLYCPIGSPIDMGTLVAFGSKVYLVRNKETEENYCYWKCSCVATNACITFNDGSIRDIYCYATDINRAITDTGTVFSFLSGNLVFSTEANETTKEIVNYIDSTFNQFGRTWKVDNAYYKDGFLHIVAEVTANQADPEPEPEEPTEEIYPVTISASSNTIKVGGSYRTLTATVMNGDTDLTENYQNSTFTWTCAIEDEDFTDNSNVTWLNTSTYNQMKIKWGSDRSYLGKTLTVTCVIDGTLTGTIDLLIS